MDVLGVGQAAGGLFWAINGIRLRQQLGSLVTEECEPMGDGWDPHLALTYLDELSAPRAGKFPAGHTALLVCSECGDLECGAVSAAVDFPDMTVTWTDFRWQQPSSWAGVAEGETPISFTFDRDGYLRAIETAREKVTRAITEQPEGLHPGSPQRSLPRWWHKLSRSRATPE